MNEPTLDDIESPGPRELTKGQRRVLGVLIEKGITTPDQYPLTLKAATTGCNQKSNRDPVSNYTEEQVQQCLDEVRGLGLVACIHTESGRTGRFRQYARKKYPFNEKQLAIMTELWLRGRQQPGELRTRASRMTEIDSQEELRPNCRAIDQAFVHADGPLESAACWWITRSIRRPSHYDCSRGRPLGRWNKRTTRAQAFANTAASTMTPPRHPTRPSANCEPPTKPWRPTWPPSWTRSPRSVPRWKTSAASSGCKPGPCRQRIRRLQSGCVVAFCVTVAVVPTAAGQDARVSIHAAEDLTASAYPAGRELQQVLEAAAAALARGETSQALTQLQAVLDGSPDRLVLIDGTYRNAAAEASRLLSQLPEAEVRLYERHSGAAAQAALARLDRPETCHVRLSLFATDTRRRGNCAAGPGTVVPRHGPVR